MPLPTDISGLRVWLKADALALNDNDLVTTWADSSGVGNNFGQAVTANKPTFKHAIVNGLPVVRFDGADDFLDAGDAMSGATAGEVFLVIKIDTDPPGAALATGIWDFGTIANAAHFPYTDSVVYDHWGSTTRQTVGNPAPALTSWRRYNVSSASGEWTARLDGTQIFTTATNTVGFNSSPRLGTPTGIDAGSFNLDGDVAELVVYDRVLSVAERAAVDAYLYEKYLAPPVGWVGRGTGRTPGLRGPGTERALGLLNQGPLNIRADALQPSPFAGGGVEIPPASTVKRLAALGVG